ncbi:MAG: hypothetical protein ACK5XN_30820 [Bacteroidota bacterium]
MKDLSSSLFEIDQLIVSKNIQTISLDIDGTLYPMKAVELRWWKSFVFSPIQALQFLLIRKRWERKRKGLTVSVTEKDKSNFEHVLLTLLCPRLVKFTTLYWLRGLKSRGLKAYYLTDHSVELKMKALDLPKLDGAFDGLTLSGELKPHATLAKDLNQALGINPLTHLHIGDRWSDEEQARLMGCHFFKVET